MKIERLTEKAWHGLIEYAFNVAYLTFVFAAFTQYRLFLFAEYSITYINYWLALIGALILGKVVMIGSVFRLAQCLEDKPLIVPTILRREGAGPRARARADRRAFLPKQRRDMNRNRCYTQIRGGG
jgi:hypothetical protein